MIVSFLLCALDKSILTANKIVDSKNEYIIIREDGSHTIEKINEKDIKKITHEGDIRYGRSYIENTCRDYDEYIKSYSKYVFSVIKPVLLNFCEGQDRYRPVVNLYPCTNFLDDRAGSWVLYYGVYDIETKQTRGCPIYLYKQNAISSPRYIPLDINYNFLNNLLY